MYMPRFLDLFAGAGGLSEGFLRAGYKAIAHVEMDVAACYTLKTRMAYHWLCEHNQLDIYGQYVNREITHKQFYKHSLVLSGTMPQPSTEQILQCSVSLWYQLLPSICGLGGTVVSELGFALQPRQ